MTIATVIIESDDPSPVLVDGVIVRVFDTGGSLITSDTSDVNGEAVFDIPDDDYHLYFYKQGVTINDGMPQLVTVDAADVDVPPNTFKVIVHVHSLPEAVDPLQVRISGYIRGADGAFTKDGRLTFEPCRETGVLGNNVIAPQHSVSVAPDENGYYEFNLLRGLEYRGFFHMLNYLLSKEPPELDIRTPDLPALDITALLFPVPVAAFFDPDALVLSAGDDADDSISLSIAYSDGSVRSYPPRFTSLSASSDDEDVAIVEMLTDKVLITPLSAGVANITIVRTISDTIYFDPTPAFTSETLVVTVT